MTEPSTTEPLSFRAAAGTLKHKDLTGRALKAIVLQRERELGVQIATRLGQHVKQDRDPHLRITLGALYKHCPEFKPERTSEDMTKSVRAYITAIEDRIAEVTADKIQEIVMPHFKADRKRLVDLEDATDTLTETTEALKAEDKKTLGLVEELSRLVAAISGAKKAS